MIIIKECDEQLLYFFAGELFLLDAGNETLTKLSFEEFIRFIDTLPDEAAKWKQETILKAAQWVGMLRCA